MIKKTATAIIIKFLKQEQCFKEFVVARRKKVGAMGMGMSPKEVIESSVTYLSLYGYPISSLFSSISASFDWGTTKCMFGKYMHWEKINIRWCSIWSYYELYIK